MINYADLKTTNINGMTVTREDKINYYEAMKKSNMEKYKGIKALSVRQPWASLVINGWQGNYKDIENRTWNTHYRGYMLIHAGTAFEDHAVGAINSLLWDLGCDSGISGNPDDYPRGGFIGLCRLNDVVLMDDSPWFAGPRGFKLRMPKAIDFMPFPGALGLFGVNDSIIEKITIK